MRKKLITALMAASLIVAFAQPASAKGEATLVQKTKRTAAIVEGDTAWVSVTWTARHGDVFDVKMYAFPDAKDVTVQYPENTGDHSSLMVDDTVLEKEIDFSSFRLHVPYGTKQFKMRIVATWNDGKRDFKDEFVVHVPVGRHNGDDVAQSTTDLGAIGSEPVWAGVTWTGIAPVVEDVRMTVDVPGAVVTYPNEGSFTSLYYDDTLEDGETDTTRFLLDASSLTPGAYSGDVTLSYTLAGRTQSVDGSVDFTVE